MSQAPINKRSGWDLVARSKATATVPTLQVRRALNTLREQLLMAWRPTCWRSAACAGRLRLPEMPAAAASMLAEMAQLRVHRMRYEELLNKQPQLANTSGQ